MLSSVCFREAENFNFLFWHRRNRRHWKSASVGDTLTISAQNRTIGTILGLKMHICVILMPNLCVILSVELFEQLLEHTIGVPSCTGHLVALFFLHFKKVSNENTISVFCRRRFIVHKIKKITVTAAFWDRRGSLGPSLKLNKLGCSYPIQVGVVLP